MIELKNITKKYMKDKKSIEVLKNINYRFENGTFYYIKGESGSGKTTLIQLLGLFMKLDSGKILINDIDINKLNDDEKAEFRNKEIGFVFQSYYLNPLMKAYENVMLPTYACKNMNDDEREKKAMDLLNKLGLKTREKHFPKELSGGECQRVAIARALINDANIILADEPTGALDSANTRKVIKILKSLSEEGKCVIVVSHNEALEKYADVVLELKNQKFKEVRR